MSPPRGGMTQVGLATTRGRWRPTHGRLGRTPEKGGLDGRWPQTEQTPTLGTGPEPVNRPRWDEDESARSDPLSGVSIRVEGVAALQDVEGFRFLVRVRGVVEVWVLPGLSEGPVSAGLRTRCFARDVCLEVTHRQDDGFS